MSAQRLPLIDAARAIASQLIVLHHLAWYGPLGDTVRPLAPVLVDWLTYDARRAVQVFLVIGGFIAAMALAPAGVPTVRRPLAAIGRRWLRLAPPYLCAILTALLAGVAARALLQHDSVPGPPTLAQVAANALMLQDVLGIEALSAGAWYVAIDLQLYAGFVLLLWAAASLGGDPRRRAQLAIGATVALGCAGLFVWGRDDSLEAWAAHFVGAFALGAAAWWAGDPRRPVAWLLALAAVGGLALLLDWRGREAVAVAAALALCAARRSDVLARWPRSPLLARLGEISYSVFVVHYSVCLVANALASALFPGRPWIHLLFFVGAWLASTLAGAALYRWVEAPARQWGRRSTGADEAAARSTPLPGA
jgi:peptidoglycan/LPS O-acetylase OafA/YrhL